MRVLLQGRSQRSIESTPGGDQVQIEQTAAALIRDFGIAADISSSLEPPLNGFDIVHLFGLVRPQDVWVQACNARRQNTPIALSTVYCDVWEFEQFGRGGALGWLARNTNRDIVEALKAGGRGVVSHEWHKGTGALIRRGYTAMQREILAMSSVFLPNSMSEWRRVSSDFGLTIPSDRVIPVPNAVVPLNPDKDGEMPARFAPLMDRIPGCVLSVARVEGRKNQLNLIAAVAGTDYTLVLAGKPAANQRRYVAQVDAAAAALPNVLLLGPVTEQEKIALFAAARVHALPSWMETTGLSSLEAAAMDCSVVVSPNGDTYEYFGDYAHYCDPASPESIRGAIDRAALTGPSRALADLIAAKYTWREAAAKSLAAYRFVLDHHA